MRKRNIRMVYNIMLCVSVAALNTLCHFIELPHCFLHEIRFPVSVHLTLFWSVLTGNGIMLNKRWRLDKMAMWAQRPNTRTVPMVCLILKTPSFSLDITFKY
jgi:hypothetical protein